MTPRLLSRTGMPAAVAALVAAACLAGAAAAPALAGTAPAGSLPTNSGAVKIAADTTDEGSFGISVDLTPDGQTAIVGAQQHNGNRGGAYLFQDESGTWTKTADLTKSASTLAYGDSYGNAVAISADGTWAMIGEVGWQSLTGRVFVLHKTAKRWTVAARLKAPHAATYTHFGDSISMDSAGDTAVIGELGADGFVGRAFVFSRQSDGTWKRSARLTPRTTDETDFGQSVAISADGSTIVVGANTYQSGLGAAYVLRHEGVHWKRTALLAGQVAGSNFGNTVAVNATGTVVAVGAVYEGAGGAAYLYQRGGGSWTQTAHLTVDGSSEFGSSVGLDAAGDEAVVGAQFTDTAGTASVYTNDGSGWTLADTLTPTVTDEALFGVSTSLDAAGDLGIVGAAFDDDGQPGQSGFGAVYLEPLP